MRFLQNFDQGTIDGIDVFSDFLEKKINFSIINELQTELTSTQCSILGFS